MVCLNEITVIGFKMWKPVLLIFAIVAVDGAILDYERSLHKASESAENSKTLVRKVPLSEEVENYVAKGTNEDIFPSSDPDSLEKSEKVLMLPEPTGVEQPLADNEGSSNALDVASEPLESGNDSETKIGDKSGVKLTETSGRDRYPIDESPAFNKGRPSTSLSQVDPMGIHTLRPDSNYNRANPSQQEPNGVLASMGGINPFNGNPIEGMIPSYSSGPQQQMLVGVGQEGSLLPPPPVQFFGQFPAHSPGLIQNPPQMNLAGPLVDQQQAVQQVNRNPDSFSSLINALNAPGAPSINPPSPAGALANSAPNLPPLNRNPNLLPSGQPQSNLFAGGSYFGLPSPANQRFNGHQNFFGLGTLPLVTVRPLSPLASGGYHRLPMMTTNNGQAFLRPHPQQQQQQQQQQQIMLQLTPNNNMLLKQQLPPQFTYLRPQQPRLLLMSGNSNNGQLQATPVFPQSQSAVGVIRPPSISPHFHITPQGLQRPVLIPQPQQQQQKIVRIAQRMIMI